MTKKDVAELLQENNKMLLRVNPEIRTSHYSAGIKDSIDKRIRENDALILSLVNDEIIKE